MLADKNAMATIAVKDLAKARKFYEGTLHLKLAGPESKEAVTYKSGNSTVVVYPSEFAGTNKATSATWGVGAELEACVEANQLVITRPDGKQYKPTIIRREREQAASH